MLHSSLAALDLDWTRETMFLMCAVGGGLVIIIQLGLLMIGMGGADDFDGLADGEMELGGSDSAFGFLSVRAVAAFLCFFGLAGWGATSAGWSLAASIGIAIVAGFAIMLVVVYILSLQRKLYSEGNLKPELIVGQIAKVYLRIPAQGRGKITVSIQDRSQQYDATTASTFSEEIPTGSEVRITRMITPGSFEVELIN